MVKGTIIKNGILQVILTGEDEVDNAVLKLLNGATCTLVTENLKIHDKTITGGSNQKNPCHITELLSACAAYDFFTRENGFEATKAEYVYKAVAFKDNCFSFSFNDFTGNANKAGDIFGVRPSLRMAGPWPRPATMAPPASGT